MFARALMNRSSALSRWSAAPSFEAASGAGSKKSSSSSVFDSSLRKPVIMRLKEMDNALWRRRSEPSSASLMERVPSKPATNLFSWRLSPKSSILYLSGSSTGIRGLSMQALRSELRRSEG